MGSSDNIPVDIEFVFKAVNAEKQAATIKKEIIDVGATTDKVAEQIENNFTESFTNAAAAAKKVSPAFTQGAAGAAQFAKGNYQLSYSMQQVARELPNLAISPQLFIMAISNNLPILQDNIRKVRLENEALKASGESFTPVWKQLVKSLFSWQTALIAGITIFTVYGKEIFAAVGKLFSFRDASQLTRQELEKLNTTLGKNMGSELGKMEFVFDKLNSLKEGTVEYYEAKKEIIDQFGTYLNGLDREITSLNNVAEAYRIIRSEIIKTAKEKTLSSIFQEQRDIATKTYLDQLPNIRELLVGKYGDAMGETYFKLIDKQMSEGKGFSYDVQRLIDSFKQTGTQTFTSTSGAIQTVTYEYNDLQEAINKVTEAQTTFEKKVAGAKSALNYVFTDNGTIEKTTDLIKLKELELEQAKLLPGTTKEEIAVRNAAVAAIESQIKALRELGATNGESGIKAIEKEIARLREKLGTGTVEQDVKLQIEIANKQAVIDDFNSKVREALKKLFNDDIQITKIQPIAPKNIAIGLSTEVTKTLQPMKLLTAEQKKQLEQQSRLASDAAVYKENYEKIVPVIAESLFYMEGIVSTLAQQLNLSESQTEALQNSFKMLSGMAEIATGNVIQGASMIVESLLTALIDVPEEMSKRYKDLYDQIQKTGDEIQSILENISAYDGSTKYILLRLERDFSNLRTEAEQLNEATKNVAFGSLWDLNNLFKDTTVFTSIAQLKDEIEDLTKKLAYGNLNNQQRESIQAVIDSYNALLAQFDSLTEQITGTTIADFSQALSDAVIEGAGAWDVWEQKAIDVIKHVASQQLASKLLEQPITEAISVLVKASGDGLTADEALNFKETIKAIYEEVGPAYEAAIAALESVGINLNANSGYEAVKGSSISATEDSVNLLNGLITGLRIDVKNILIQMALHDDDFVKRLGYLKEIAENTRHNARLANIEKSLDDMLKLQKDRL